MTMEMYQHDRASMFQFVLRGDLTGERVQDLEHAWITAKSILNGREVVIDVGGVSGADTVGVELLSRMRDSGARLTVAGPAESEEFLRSLGLWTPAPGGRSARSRVLQFFRACRIG